MVTHQDYIERLGEHWQCSWILETPGDVNGVKLTVESLHLATTPKAEVNYPPPLATLISAANDLNYRIQLTTDI